MRHTIDRVLSHLRRLSASAPEGDRQLLSRFAAARDEAAFAALVARHGPMVLGVGRRLLGDRPVAEDVFQATFLVLARKAGAIRRRESVGGWLYGVAYRLALKARAGEARRRRHERAAAASRPPVSPDEACREVLAILDEELLGLPERYRLPLVLCYLEGRTQDEAARELGWSLSTLRRRLERGRELLRARMTGRGATLSAGLFVAALAAPATPDVVPPTLAAAAVRVAAGAAAAAAVEALARSAEAAFLTRGKVAAALLLAGLLAVGAWAGRGGPAAPPADDPPARATAPPADLYGDPLPPGAVARMGTTAFHAPGSVRAAAFSPDGKYLATAGLNHHVRVWDAKTGRQVYAFPRSVGESDRALAFSPDGKRLACTTNLGNFIAWDLTTGAEEFTAKSPAKGKFWREAPGFRPDGTPVRVLQDGDEERVSLLDARTNERLGAAAAAKNVWVFALAADGKSLAVAEGTKVRLLDLAAGKELRSFGGHDREVPSVALSRDGRRLASSDASDTVRVWDAETGKELRRLAGSDARDADRSWQKVALSADGAVVAVSSAENRSIRLFDVKTGKELRRLDCPDVTALCLDFSPDGKTLTAGGRAGLRLWDVPTGKDWHAARPGHVSGVGSLAFSPDGKMLLSAGTDATRRDGKSHEPAGREDGSVRLWDARTGKQLRLWREHRGAVDRVAYSPDGKRAASAGSGQVTVFDPRDGEVVFRRGGKGVQYRDVAFSPDGSLVAAAEEEGAIRLREAASGRLVRTLPEKEEFGIAPHLSFSPDGRVLAGNGNQQLRLWDVSTGKELPGPKGLYVTGIAFSPDGETLATIDGGPAVTFRRAATGKAVAEENVFGEEESHHSVLALAYPPDGRTLALGCSDGTVRVWEAATRRERFRFANPGGTAWSLAFSPDGRTLATGNSDTTITVWDVAALPVPRRGGQELTDRDLDRLWTALADPDPAKAYEALRSLRASPAKSLPDLRERLRPRRADAATLKRLLADLDSPEFGTREQAAAALVELGDAALPALREVLKSPSAELRRGAGAVVERLEGSERLRMRRAVEVVEKVADADAARLLDEWAEGEPDAAQTREAKAARKRLGDRREK
jgi:RNA polymerase sigma factor (sigma-70 family)